MEYAVIELPDIVKRFVERGEFTAAEKVIDRLLSDKRLPEWLRLRLEFEKERLMRIRKDCPYSRKEAFEKLREEIPDLTEEDFEKWKREGYVDYLVIEGEERYFKNFIPNLFRFCAEAEKRRVKKVDKEREAARKLLHERLDLIMKVGEESREPYILPMRFKIEMTVTLKPNVVPDGETVRCWMPIPQVCELHPYVKVVSTEPKAVKIADEKYPQRTVYFEQRAEEGKPLSFKVVYEYEARAFYAKVDPSKVEAYDEDSEVYVKYTREQPPHIVFTPYLRKLARDIVGGEKNPYLKAKKIYMWITENVKYASAYEYAIYRCISEYVATNLKGDCGMQALLFITLCRIVGVPARWQSSWYMNPVKPGLHDWAQFYIEPYGWLYVDCSFGGARKDMPKYRLFYFGNIDHFRMAANSDICVQLDPPKRYIRSDPVDNQRGELEWKGGNLYYDKWNYNLKILEVKELWQ